MQTKIKTLLAWWGAIALCLSMSGMGHYSGPESSSVPFFVSDPPDSLLKGEAGEKPEKVQNEALEIKAVLGLDVEPVLSMCEGAMRSFPLVAEVFGGQDTIGRVGDTLSNCPYYLNFSFVIQVLQNLSVGDSLHLNLELELSSAAVPFLPQIEPPTFGYASIISSNSRQLNRDEELFTPQSATWTVQKIEKSILTRSDSIALPGKLGKDVQGLVIPNSTRQVLRGQIMGKINRELGDVELILYSGGLVVTVMEVIDPIDEVKFRLGLERVNESPGEVHFSDSVERFFAGHPDNYPKGRNYVYKDVAGKNDSAEVSFYSQADQDFFKGPSFRLFDSNSPVPSGIEFVALSFEGEEIVEGGTPEELGFLGYASERSFIGLYPLYRARQVGENPAIPPFRYALCLEELVADPNYDVETVVAYVLPPSDGIPPCPL